MKSICSPKIPPLTSISTKQRRIHGEFAKLGCTEKRGDVRRRPCEEPLV
ncbi:hypothetical protein V6Z11_A08G123500 [Gossypium hirsutum]